MIGPVQKAIRRSTFAGQRLHTPGKQAPFSVRAVDERGVTLLFGSKETPTLVEWQCLEGIPGFLAGKGWVRVGTVFYVAGDPSTLDGYLKGYINRGTATWVASLLESAGVVEIRREVPLQVRLSPGWVGGL